jgi:hypothetical protein
LPFNKVGSELEDWVKPALQSKRTKYTEWSSRDPGSSLEPPQEPKNSSEHLSNKAAIDALDKLIVTQGMVYP